MMSAAILAMTLMAPEIQAQGFLNSLKDRAVDKAKERISDKVSDKVDREVSDAADNVLDGKKKDKKSKSESNSENSSAKNETSNAAPTINTSTDFKRGEKILFQDDFKNEKIGEFPSKWDLLDGKAEVKKVGDHMTMEVTNNGFVTPLVKQSGAYLSEQFTIEFDFYFWADAKENVGLNDLKLILMGSNERNKYDLDPESGDCIFNGLFTVCGAQDKSYTYKATNGKAINTTYNHTLSNGWHTVQASFNQRAFKMYIDGNRVVNLPNMKQPTWFGFQVPFDYENLTFIKNVVVAQGAVELYGRNATDIDKAMAETGQFVTNNILFATGKADIKPESMAEIQRVADYMLKNKSARFEVQGHCDNQGTNEVNDPLSQKRAEAIVNALVKLGVDEFNLKPVGKGSHEPVADNKTEEGRAKNRRVVFIKR